MLSNRLTFAALAVGCLLAAAGGGYLASRWSAPPVAASDASASNLRSTSAAVPTTEFVSEKASDERPTTDAVPAPPSTPAPVARRPEASAPPRTANPAGPRAPKTGIPQPLPSSDRAAQSSVPIPSEVQGPTPSIAVPSVEPSAQVPRADDRVTPDFPKPEPAQPNFEELVIAPDSVIGLQAETSVSSDRARVEDRVEARVTRDVRVRDLVAVPAGARAIGSVTLVERGGKFKERARLGIRFHTLVLADGTRLPISTETIYRDGDAPGNESAAKIGGATVAGTILGAIIGGGKGAAIGATAGAAAGAGTVIAGDRNTATLRSGEPVTIRILSPVTVSIDK
jgi:hypothetical protein